ncbi:MAG: peptidase C45 [Cytophagaceae bacterium]|nr:MAG: peptidase C45 [Cytophagaceae bacterium]
MLRKIIKWLALGTLSVLALLVGTGLYLYSVAAHRHPAAPPTALLHTPRQQLGPQAYTLGHNWLRKSRSGWWEMHLEGEPFERGVANGVLCRELCEYQEQAFYDQICKLVPSAFHRSFLKYLIAFFNRNLESSLTEEQRLEIYGVAQTAYPKFDEIGPAYPRLLNYHAAHDIGHALQNLALVGCSSFATWGDKSADGQLLIGRNFDFYVGDQFADNKVVDFVTPARGHRFVTVSWCGMSGVVSGMNMAGLTITLNAAKSALPTGSATPISVLAREILQYAGTIDEAVAIAQQRHTFVSESLLIGSAADNKAVVIEKTPDSVAVYDPHQHEIICTNHYQSGPLGKAAINQQQMHESASVYREQRLAELMERAGPLTPTKAASILRDQGGLGDKFIGYGNEKAVNQLICHHSVIFQPAKRIIWLAAAPWQLGKYVAYDLNKVFAMKALGTDHELIEADTIAAAPFLRTPAYANYVAFRQLAARVQSHDPTADPLALLRLNPEYYHAYALAGDALFRAGKFAEAQRVYRQGLTKEIATKGEEAHLRNQAKKCGEKLQSS